ncbi:MAG: hypothetical protein WDZ27_00100 [Waddliaceae bacterium]
MSISFNIALSWESYLENRDWQSVSTEKPLNGQNSEARRAANALFEQTFKQLPLRGIQFIRDTARLVLKVPIRSIWTPIVLEKNWKQRERAKINTKLVGYSLVQLLSVPVKFLVALVAIATTAVSLNKAKLLLDSSEAWTAYLDGRASQLEALKEVGRKNAKSPIEYNAYKSWLYTINPKRCR